MAPEIIKNIILIVIVFGCLLAVPITIARMALNDIRRDYYDSYKYYAENGFPEFRGYYWRYYQYCGAVTGRVWTRHFKDVFFSTLGTYIFIIFLGGVGLGSGR